MKSKKSKYKVLFDGSEFVRCQSVTQASLFRLASKFPTFLPPTTFVGEPQFLRMNSAEMREFRTQYADRTKPWAHWWRTHPAECRVRLLFSLLMTDMRVAEVLSQEYILLLSDRRTL